MACSKLQHLAQAPLAPQLVCSQAAADGKFNDGRQLEVELLRMVYVQRRHALDVQRLVCWDEMRQL